MLESVSYYLDFIIVSRFHYFCFICFIMCFEIMGLVCYILPWNFSFYALMGKTLCSSHFSSKAH